MVFKIGEFLVNTKLLMLVCKRETLLAGTLCFIVGIWCKLAQAGCITSVEKLKL
jgi:hypothetical protein